MEHRNLNPGWDTSHLADIIVRGDMYDWVFMREQAKTHAEIFDRLASLVERQIRQAERDDEFEGLSRYWVWKIWTDNGRNQYGTRGT